MNHAAQLLEMGIDPAVLLKALEDEQSRRILENRLKHYKPYPKQREFHEMGATKRERLFMAANQSGKTVAGSAEGAIHLTGRYPKGWEGRRFNRPIAAYAGSVTRETTRDGLQRLLLGRTGAFGTGMIPKDAILSTMAAQGVADAIAIVRIKNEFGPPSTLTFKSYDMGREKWQADTLDMVMFDEEPPLDIYTEGLTRTNTVADSIVYLTFTPLLGMSDVVRRFLMEKSDDRGVVTMTIDDALHYTPEQRDRIIASYPEHEREARTKGIPTMGSGRVYPVLEEMIAEDGGRIPDYWARIVGMDFGYDHPAAAVWMAWDRDADVIHIYDVYRARGQLLSTIASAIRAKGAKIPVAWPHDGLKHDPKSGEQMAESYRKEGLAMLPERAQFPDDRGNGVEAGVMELLDRMQSGRLKVARHLNDWFEEFRLYHRDEGKIVKEHDDLMDAMRYAFMCLRFAKATGERPTDGYRRKRGGSSTSFMAA